MIVAGLRKGARRPQIGQREGVRLEVIATSSERHRGTFHPASTQLGGNSGSCAEFEARRRRRATIGIQEREHVTLCEAAARQRPVCDCRGTLALLAARHRPT